MKTTKALIIVLALAIATFMIGVGKYNAGSNNQNYQHCENGSTHRLEHAGLMTLSGDRT